MELGKPFLEGRVAVRHAAFILAEASAAESDNCALLKSEAFASAVPEGGICQLDWRALCENYKTSSVFREIAFMRQHFREKVCYFYSAAVITASFLTTNK